MNRLDIEQCNDIDTLKDLAIRQNNEMEEMIKVIHARWISLPHQIDRVCSHCEHTEPYKFADKEAEIFNYCPHCGAKMDLKGLVR